MYTKVPPPPPQKKKKKKKKTGNVRGYKKGLALSRTFGAFALATHSLDSQKHECWRGGGGGSAAPNASC